MPKFSYQAIDDGGNTVKGEIDAETMAGANNILSARGYIPSKVTEQKKGSLGPSLKGLKARFMPLKPAEIIIFTKQFRTMLRAGVPIVKLLTVLRNQTENPNLQHIVSIMEGDIRDGLSLYDAFKKHPKAFSPLYCSMVQAGEASGALPDILTRLTYIIEHEFKIKSDIRSALQYPIIVMVFLAIAFFSLLTFVIPKFATIFLSAGIELPIPTQICLFMYSILANYWYLLLGGTIALVVGLNYFLRTEQGKYVFFTIFMKMPVLGPLFIKAAMSRFSSIFSILQSSGVGVLDAMKILYGTIGNAAISRELDHINERLEEGRGIAGPLSNAKYFPPMVTNMVAIGEEAGNLDEMLNEVSKHYDDELEYATKKLSEAIGPFLTVGLAGVVGFFALAIFLPMWDLTKMVK